jgi:lipopolysaccharide export system protein LptA
MNSRLIKIAFFITLLLLNSSWGASFNSPDTLKNQAAITPALSDSVVTSDSLSNDSLKVKNKDELKAVVYASAGGSLIFDVKSKKMYLFGKGEIKYDKTDLQSGFVDLNFNSSELKAKGIERVDSLGKKITDETPILSDNGEQYKGSELTYNFKTKQGTISLAENQQGDKIFRGQKVRKVSKDIFFVKDGVFTTCKGNPPVTYFTAKQMKIIQKDKIIAKWIFMWIGGVPIPVPVPFAVFPLDRGRHSGLILPNYGQDAARGFYLRGLGYYFALNDYMDLSLVGDYYFKGGWGARSRFRYKKRYLYNGEVNLGYSHIAVDNPGEPNYTRRTDWNISVRHSQKFNPTANLNVNVKYYTSNYLSNNSVNYDKLYQQNVISNATFSKRWDSGTSLTLNYYRSQNLKSGDITEKLPDVSLNLPIIYPFRSKLGSSGKMKWYEKIGFKYNGVFRNQHSINSGVENWKAGLQHSVGINTSTKIGYINFSPSFNYKEKWYNHHTEYQNYPHYNLNPDSTLVAVDSVVASRVKSYDFVRTFNLSFSASTKIYGMANINALGIGAFRHTFIPSVSYTYQPDFSTDKYPYYGEYQKVDGSVVRYDKYSSELFGGVSSNQSQSMNFSLNNVYEIKTLKDPRDTTSTSKKIKLLNWSVSSRYNFTADSLNLSDMSLRYRTSIGDYLSFNGSSSYTFYDNDGTRRINKFLAAENKGLMRITGTTFSINSRISGDKIIALTSSKDSSNSEEKLKRKRDLSNQFSIDETDNSIPWSLDFTYNYRFTKPTPLPGEVRSSIAAGISFNLTKGWKFTFRSNYDFVTKEISAPVFTAFRDMGCWEMLFTWHPVGVYRGFRFNIHLKAPELRDIKIEKSKDIFSGR